MYSNLLRKRPHEPNRPPGFWESGDARGENVRLDSLARIQGRTGNRAGDWTRARRMCVRQSKYGDAKGGDAASIARARRNSTRQHSACEKLRSALFSLSSRAR